MLNTTLTVKDGELFCALEGRLDTLSAPGFDKELEAALEGVTGLTIDCEKLSYISSAGLRTILAAEQYMEENGYRQVKILNINKAIRETFEVTGFIDVVDVE